jgi:hypothetical protein
MNDTQRLSDIVDAIEAIETYSVSSYYEFLVSQSTLSNHLANGFDQPTHRQLFLSKSDPKH